MQGNQLTYHKEASAGNATLTEFWDAQSAVFFDDDLEIQHAMNSQYYSDIFKNMVKPSVAEKRCDSPPRQIKLFNRRSKVIIKWALPAGQIMSQVIFTC